MNPSNNIFFVLIICMTLGNTIIALYSEKKIFDSGVKAYIYAYPLVLMDITQKTSMRAPINDFFHMSAFPTDQFDNVVRPNVDTLYSSAWLDLSKEPIILTVPDTHGRYYLMEMLDAWTNVFSSIGKRTTGTKAQSFAIVGPSLNGILPKNIKTIRSPTNMVWIIGRTQTNGKKDYEFVHSIQRGYTLTPLSYWNNASRSPQNSHRLPSASITAHNAAPVDQVNQMDAKTFFTIFAHALKNNPPRKEDASILVDLKEIGIEVGKELESSTLSPAILHTLDKAIVQAKKKITHTSKNFGKKINGWIISSDIGTYGIDYLKRAVVAYIALGANLPQDAIYPIAFTSADGNNLNGKNRYIIHFNKNNLPPVNAFWSITMYNVKSFFVPNIINRYALGDRNNVVFNKDGSLDIYIQHESPGKQQESNWLPAPAGNFNLTMRLYWPKKSVINGQWNPPPIEQVQ